VYFSLGQKREESRDEFGGLKGRSGRNICVFKIGEREGAVTKTTMADRGKIEKEMMEDGMGKVRGWDWDGGEGKGYRVSKLHR